MCWRNLSGRNLLQRRQKCVLYAWWQGSSLSLQTATKREGCACRTLIASMQSISMACAGHNHSMSVQCMHACMHASESPAHAMPSRPNSAFARCSHHLHTAPVPSHTHPCPPCPLTGHEVHVVCVTSKAQLLVAAASGAQPCCSLADLMAASVPQPLPRRTATSGPPGQGPGSTEASLSQVVEWRWTGQPAAKLGQGEQSTSSSSAADPRPAAPQILYHTVLKDSSSTPGSTISPSEESDGVMHVIGSIIGRQSAAPLASPPPLPPLQEPPPQQQQAVLQVAQQSGSTGACGAWVLLDADDSQLRPQDVHQRQQQEQHEDVQPHVESLFERVVTAWGARCLALVQNVHFLPFGPSGTSGRSPELLQVSSTGCSTAGDEARAEGPASQSTLGVDEGTVYSA